MTVILLMWAMAFLLGIQLRPDPGWIWGLLTLIVLPWLAGGIAEPRMTWTPWRVFRAKRWAGAVFLAFCGLQVGESAPGGDTTKVLGFMALGGFVLWRLARLKEPSGVEGQLQADADIAE